MFKNFFMKQMLKSQMKNMPADQQEKVMEAFNKDPELFTKITKELQDSIKGGKNQMHAAMEVAKKYKDQLQGLVK
jgi:hypothetical protein